MCTVAERRRWRTRACKSFGCFWIGTWFDCWTEMILWIWLRKQFCQRHLFYCFQFFVSLPSMSSSAFRRFSFRIVFGSFVEHLKASLKRMGFFEGIKFASRRSQVTVSTNSHTAIASGADSDEFNNFPGIISQSIAHQSLMFHARNEISIFEMNVGCQTAWHGIIWDGKNTNHSQI